MITMNGITKVYRTGQVTFEALQRMEGKLLNLEDEATQQFGFQAGDVEIGDQLATELAGGGLVRSQVTGVTQETGNIERFRDPE